MKTAFVMGAQKTGTSSMVGLLNSSSEILCLYETFVWKPAISRYGSRFLDASPEMRPLFGKGDAEILQSYVDLGRAIQASGDMPGLKIVGDKFAGLNPISTELAESSKIIFMQRDIRTWLAKSQIQSIYRTDLDVVGPALNFLARMIEARDARDGLIINMEDLVFSPEVTRDSAKNFLWGADLQLDLVKPKNQTQAQRKLKGSMRWEESHPSTGSRDKVLDTASELAAIEFWDLYLPLFDKYYVDPNKTDITPSERDRDLDTIRQLHEFSPIRLSTAFSRSTTKSLNSNSFKRFGRRVNGYLRG